MRLRIKEEQLNRLFVEEKDVPPFIADKFTIGDEGGNLEYAHVVNENAENEMRAYHGSGADFDRFDNSFVGSGEGAQAFGWGTYVTTDMGTAKHYAQIAHDNGNGTTYLCNGYKITKEIYVVLSIAMEHAKGNDEICSFLIDKINSLKNTLSIKTNKGSDSFELEKIKNRIEDNENALKYVKGLCGIDIKSLNSCKSGQIIYEVEIPDDNGNNYIDWKFTKYEVIERILSNLTYLRYPNINPKRISFEDIYELNIQSDKYHKAIEPKRISEDLYKLGFKGIKVPVGYLSNDNSHRGYNYVIFNEDDIEIVEKYDMFENTKKSHIIDEENIVFPNSKVQDVMYRGDNEDISTFDRKYSKKTNLYGTGFYFTNEPSHAMTYGKSKTYYLNIENPLNTDKLTITPQMVFNIVKAVAENEDYGIENYGYSATVKSVADMLMKEHNTDFSILYDLNQTCVGDLVELTLFFNKINKTTFDGFILPTETVVFDNSQIKSTTNEQITENIETEYQAYHGSHFNFDKFNHKKYLSRGAGSQSFGWGTYVTDDVTIAQSYANLDPDTRGGVTIDGIYYNNLLDISDAISDIIWTDLANNYPIVTNLDILSHNTNKRYVEDVLTDFLLDTITDNQKYFIQTQVQDFKRKIQKPYWWEQENPASILQSVVYLCKYLLLTKHQVEYQEPENNKMLYTVDIPDNDGTNYIEWYELLPHEFMVRILTKMSQLKPSYLQKMAQKDYGFKSELYKYLTAPNNEQIIDFLFAKGQSEDWDEFLANGFTTSKKEKTGEGVYYRLKEIFKSPKAASLFLIQCGFVGIKYPTGTKWSKPQGAKDDTYNYVIFDANNVKITNKQNLGESKQLTEAKNEMIVSAANYIFCEDENGELNILIGKRGSTAPQGANQWNVPMGMKEPNEEIIDTACRETFEETGLRIPKDTMEYIGNSSYGDGVRCGANFVTNLEGTTNQYQTGNGDGENSRFIWIPVSEIDNFTFAFGLDKTIKNILKTL